MMSTVAKLSLGYITKYSSKHESMKGEDYILISKKEKTTYLTCIAVINSSKPRKPCRFESAIAQTY